MNRQQCHIVIDSVAVVFTRDRIMSVDDNTVGSAGNFVCEYEPLILVTRGDEMPKANYGTRLHPTYETSIRIKNGGQQTSPHYVVKFYDQYRDLCHALNRLGIGEGLPINIDAPFPQKYPKSYVGVRLTEQQLQHRCYLLNKWMGAIFANYHRFPTKAQLLISEFLSLKDNDTEEEQNKELILALLRRKKEILIAEGIMAHTMTGPASPKRTATADGNNAPLRLTSAALSQVQQQHQGQDQGQGQGQDAAALRRQQTPILPKDSGGNSSGSAAAAPLPRGDKEVVIGGFLGVSVRPGTQMVRKKDDKLHHSYEMCVRMLPLEEVQYNVGDGQASIDPEAYAAQAAGAELKVVTAFSTYRELKDDLEKVHVYSSDNPTDSSAARQQGNKVIVIDAPFPPTMTKSSLGVGLNEAEILQRAELLNNWLGILMLNFNMLPRDGKELITDFLGMRSLYSSDPQMPGAPIGAKYAAIHSILRGTYVPPKRAAPGPSSSPRRTLVSFFTRREEPASPTLTTNAAFDVSGARPESLGRTLPHGGSENGSVVSGGDSQTDAGMEAGGGNEVTVGQHLGVSVVRSKPLAKKKGESRSHPGYEVLIRILPLEECMLPEGEKRQIDAEKYHEYVEAGPLRIAFVFDAYRTLKNDLEMCQVYSLDAKAKADAVLEANPEDAAVVLVDARFPRTYNRQSLGFKLSETQLNQRAVLLNQWFGALMQSFPLLPFLAKEHVLRFLSATDMEAGFDGEGLNPAKHPRDDIIVTMLRGTYTPPLRPAPIMTLASSGEAVGGKGKKGKGKKGKSRGRSRSNSDSGGDGGEEGGFVPDAGCGCTIM